MIHEVGEGSKHTQFDVFLLFLRILLRFAPQRRRRRRVCADCIPLWRVFSVGAGLGFVEGSENDIRGDVAAFEVTSATSPASPARGARSSCDGATDAVVVYLLVSNSGVAPRRRPASASIIVFIVGVESQLVVFVIVRPITFRRARQGQRRADSVALACAQFKVLA